MQTRGVEHMLRVVPPALCARVREKVLRHAASAASGRSLRDRVLNFLGYHPNSDVLSPRHRQHVALGWTDDVESILRLATRAAAPAFARAGITHGSRLVELSSMVAFPGAEEQNVHSDVRPDAKRRICTLWVALQMVESANGPTFYYPRDPNDLDSFDWKRLTGEAVGPVVYGADGEVEYDPNAAMDTDDHPFKGVEPARCVMDAGDAFLMDCRTWHGGGANTGQVPRAMVSATFREDPPSDNGGLVEVEGEEEDGGGDDDGFTYRLGPEIPRFTLGELLR
mmetsp:Transcript_79558/g.227149  ORF Transcript_79558/g.227149 Transcript_79558/m.227149 type:complete len:281 (+) Transcript_79558:118-960(+)